MNLVWPILIMQRGHVMLSPHFFILFLFIYLGTHRKKSDGGIGIFSLQNFFSGRLPVREFSFFFSVLIATLCGKFIWRKFAPCT